MSSNIEGAPVCISCGRSSGISGEVSTGITWRRGEWRYASTPDVDIATSSVDLSCPCGSSDIEYVEGPNNDR